MNLLTSIQRFSLQFLLSLPENWKLKLAGGEPIIIDGNQLDLDMQLICQLAKFNPDPSNYPPPIAREKFNTSIRSLMKGNIPVAKVETTVIGTKEDAIKIRIYNPDPSLDNQPTLVYFHGGGFVIGDLEMVDDVCRYIAYHTPCMVFSVNYRLAPEYPFPIPPQDCFRAYEWIRENGYRLGASPDNMAVAGDSAGGNLSLAVTLLCKEKGIPLPKFQGLIYPVTDLAQEHASYEKFAEGFLLTRKMMNWFKGHYITKISDLQNPLVSPLYISNFSDYPPTYISTAGFDPLRDEGRALVGKLKKDKVRVVHSEFSSLIHGYFTMGSMVRSARIAVDDFLNFLKREWYP